MLEPRRSAIPPALRPYVLGSRVESNLGRSDDDADSDGQDPPADNLRPAVVVLASEEDSTAEHFARVALELGVECAVRPLETFGPSFQLNPSEPAPFPPDAPPIYYRGAGTQDPALLGTICVLEEALTMYPGVVVNRPGSASTNHSKPLHITRLGGLGNVGVPSSSIRLTLRRGDDGANIVKSLSYERSIVVAADDARIVRSDRPQAPILMQHRLVGTQYRVHVCQDEVVVVRIEGDALDYRYAGDMNLRPATLPDSLEAWCRSAVSSEGLLFGGVDLVDLDDGTGFACFEVNPTPGYHYFEEAWLDAGERPRITEALLRALGVAPIAPGMP